MNMGDTDNYLLYFDRFIESRLSSKTNYTKKYTSWSVLCHEHLFLAPTGEAQAEIDTYLCQLLFLLWVCVVFVSDAGLSNLYLGHVAFCHLYPGNSMYQICSTEIALCNVSLTRAQLVCYFPLVATVVGNIILYMDFLVVSVGMIGI